MTLSPPRCAVNMEQRLAALRRDQEIDGLRVYLVKYELFPRNRDPFNSPIRVEELKELVKHWKLHRQRGFWRDHPDKEDLVRALLQHIKSEAANKKRRQDAQDKYRAKSAAANAAGLDAAKLRDFANILHHADASATTTCAGSDGGGDRELQLAVAAAKRRNFGGGDLFYQRGDYDEGMIYLSRINRTSFQSEQCDPRADLLSASASAPALSPLDQLMLLGGSTVASPLPSKADGKPFAASVTSTATMAHNHVTELAVQPTSASAALLLTREARMRSVEGFYTISCHRGFEAQLVREGALTAISSVAKADDAAIRLFAAVTLLNLTIPPPSRGQTQQQQAVEADTALTVQTSNYQSQHHQQLHPSMTHLPLATRELYAKMVDQGAVATLLELAHTPHPTVKALCARALLRLSLDDAHHFALVHEGAVATLAQLMAAASGADDDVKETCMLALVNLAAVPRAVACDTVLAALTVLVRTGDAQTQRRCAQAMLNLSILPTTRSSLVEDGAVAALALLAATRQVPVLDAVACVLCNLAGVKTNQEQLVKSGALPIALDVLDAVERAHSQISERSVDEEGEDDDEEQDKAKTADEDDQDAQDAARLLLARIRKNCVNVVAYLCCNAKLQARVGGAGAVAKMLRVLQSIRVLGRPVTGSAIDSINSDTEKLIVLAVANLALEDRCRPGIVQDGAVSVLLGILQAEDTAEPPAAAAVNTRPSSPTVHQIPQEQAGVLLKLDCVTALSNLMLHPLNFSRLVDEGVVPALIAQLRGGRSADIQRACAFALRTLARDPGMKTRLAQVTTPDDADQSGGAIPAMLAFASAHLLDAELCGVCVSFLLHLSTRAENHEALFFEGAPALLVRVLLRRKAARKTSNAASEPPQTVIYSLWMDCMAALANLARCVSRQPALLADGVMDAIQRFLTASGSARDERGAVGRAVDKKVVKTQLSAASILLELHALCCQPDADGANSSSSDAFFASLLLLSTQTSVRNSQLDKKAVLIQQRAAQRCSLTIARVALLLPRGLKLLAGHPEIPPALNMVMRTGLHEAQVCAAIALCNLATERGGLPRRVWRDPTTEDFLVIALLRLNRDQTKVVCAKTLFNLLSHEDTRAQLVADGALYALLKLAKLESDEIRDLALRAVYNLSLDAKRARQLLDMELVRVLTKMYQPEFARAIKKLVCGILSNLSSGGSGGLSREEADAEATRNALQMLHEGALGVLRNLVKVRDPETKVYALNTLYNLSCASDAWEMLVRDEANVLALLVAELKADGSREGARYAALALANLSDSCLAISQLTGEQPSGANGAASTAIPAPVAATVSVLNEAMKRSLAGLSADDSARSLAVSTLCACVLTLRNLFTRAGNRRAFVASGGVQTLAAMLSSEALVEREPATLQVAADMLCVLAKRQDELGGTLEEDAASNLRKQERLVKDGVVRALAAIVRGSVGSGRVSVAQETKTCMDIAASLCCLSTNAACHEGMLRDGALDAVADLCRTNPGDTRSPFKGLVGVRGEEFVSLVAVTLRNLSRVDPSLDGSSSSTADEVKGQRLAAQPATVQVALALALSTAPDTRMHVAATLLNLSRYRKCRQQMIRNDAARVLLRLGSPSATALKRHLCALALQRLAKHTTAGEDGQTEVHDDPQVAKVVQEGIVAAIAGLAEQHPLEVLVGVGPSITSIVDMPVGVEDAEQLVLVRADYRAMAQKGAAPDWERVLITDLSAWPELSAGGDGSEVQRAVLETEAAGDEEAAVVEEEGDSSDEDEVAVADGKKPGTPTGKAVAKVRSPMAKGVLSPVMGNKKATAVMAPRTCSSDVVLGSLQLLSDGGGDKVRVNVDAELALRRTASAASTSSTMTTGLGGVDNALPKLRPATAPDPVEDVTSPAPGLYQSPHHRGSKQSTLKQVREDASSPSSSSTSGLSLSPMRSPLGSSAAMGTPKRRSRTLEPLGISPPSPSSKWG